MRHLRVVFIYYWRVFGVKSNCFHGLAFTGAINVVGVLTRWQLNANITRHLAPSLFCSRVQPRTCTRLELSSSVLCFTQHVDQQTLVGQCEGSDEIYARMTQQVTS